MKKNKGLFLYICLFVIFFISCKNSQIKKDDYDVLSAIIYEKPHEKPDTNYHFIYNLHPYLEDTTWYHNLRTIVYDHLPDIQDIEEIISDMERKKRIEIIDVNQIKSNEYQDLVLKKIPEKFPKVGGFTNLHLLFSVVGYNNRRNKAVILYNGWHSSMNNFFYVFYLEKEKGMNWKIVKRISKYVT